jgi:hypothetical protein
MPHQSRFMRLRHRYGVGGVLCGPGAPGVFGVGAGVASGVFLPGRRLFFSGAFGFAGLGFVGLGSAGFGVPGGGVLG